MGRGAARGACKIAEELQNRGMASPFGKVGDEAIEPKDGERAREVVAQGHQAPLTAHLIEASNEEVAVAGPAFEGAEGVFGEFGSASHLSASVLHPGAMAFQHRFMLPAIDGARR